MKNNLGTILISSTIISVCLAFILRNYSDIYIFLFCGLAFVCYVGFLFTKSHDTKKKESQFKDKSDNYISDENVNSSKSIYSDTGLSRLIFDHQNKQVYILKNNVEPVSLPYSSILESELIENGNTITKTSRVSQLGGALVGGIVGGGVGTVIGGLSAKQTSSQNISTLQIKINTNDLYSPTNSFSVKDSTAPLKKESVTYNKMYDQAYEIHKLVSAIINEQENNAI